MKGGKALEMEARDGLLSEYKACSPLLQAVPADRTRGLLPTSAVSPCTPTPLS